jgi:hypothetical protein
VNSYKPPELNVYDVRLSYFSSVVKNNRGKKTFFTSSRETSVFNRLPCQGSVLEAFRRTKPDKTRAFCKTNQVLPAILFLEIENWTCSRTRLVLSQVLRFLRLKPCETAFFSGCCSETEVSEQRY